ncbi:hypothetical protein C8R46DRAFT_1226924 [Mycena filopes]|nr:hypothetical protein C8R46DRAFT_1226924 [Mycena filopes]
MFLPPPSLIDPILQITSNDHGCPPNLIGVHTSLIPEISGSPAAIPGKMPARPRPRLSRLDANALMAESSTEGGAPCEREAPPGWLDDHGEPPMADQAVAEALVAVFAASSAHSNDNSNSPHPTDEDAEDAPRRKRQLRKAPRAAEEERRARARPGRRAATATTSASGSFLAPSPREAGSPADGVSANKLCALAALRHYHNDGTTNGNGSADELERHYLDIHEQGGGAAAGYTAARGEREAWARLAAEGEAGGGDGHSDGGARMRRGPLRERAPHVSVWPVNGDARE